MKFTTILVIMFSLLLVPAVAPAQDGGLPPEGLFLNWLVFGHFGGYDFRNCEMSDQVPGFEGVIVARCWGPPLLPVDAVEEPARYRIKSTRARSSRR